MDSLGTARLIEEVDPRRAVAASATISMDWSRDELEELFARARSDTVLLMFDGQELADAVADVEAHGLRQRALVFTVAATGTIGSGAGIANAAIPADFADGGGPAVTATAATPVTDVSSTDGYGTTAAASSGTTISLDRVATDASVVGGVLLTIAGATFASRRVRPARPA